VILEKLNQIMLNIEIPKMEEVKREKYTETFKKQVSHILDNIDKYCEELFNSSDINKNGTLDLSEFNKFLLNFKLEIKIN
jgi:hypothetical protein